MAGAFTAGRSLGALAAAASTLTSFDHLSSSSSTSKRRENRRFQEQHADAGRSRDITFAALTEVLDADDAAFAVAAAGRQQEPRAAAANGEQRGAFAAAGSNFGARAANKRGPFAAFQARFGGENGIFEASDGAFGSRCGVLCEEGAAMGRSRAMPRLTTFGEAMIRYVPDPDTSRPVAGKFATRWLQSGGGAELNLTIALCNLGWGDRARWISVVPNTQMGDIILRLASEAYSTGGQENLKLVKRVEGELGIYHAWPLEGKVCFQRRNSAFGQMDPDLFDESFWRCVLVDESKEDEAPHIFHLTGITPLIGVKSYKAWWRALRVAREVKKQQDPSAKNRLFVTLDMNHRPALGTFEDLWVLIEPHLTTTDLLVLSIGDIVKLGSLLDVPEAANLLTETKIEQSAQGISALNKAVEKALKALQTKFGHKTNLAVCCKQRTPELRKPGGPPVQIRWSMACLKSGAVVSTFDTAITQEVLEEIGGGDSWLSGTLDGLFGGCANAEAVAPDSVWSEAALKAAMRRGDLMATLKQQQVGDFSHVMQERLDEEHQKLLKKHGLSA